MRDHDSTSYVSSFQSATDFGVMLRREARRRGSGTAKEIVLLIDGAAALENVPVSSNSATARNLIYS